MKVSRVEDLKKMLCSCSDKCDTGTYFKDLRELGDLMAHDEDFRMLAEFNSALASRERLIIIATLLDNDRCVCELETVLNKSQSTISHHLRKLEKINLISGYKKGNYSYYHLNTDYLKEYLRIIPRILNVGIC